jgi:hypothetical protein
VKDSTATQTPFAGSVARSVRLTAAVAPGAAGGLFHAQVTERSKFSIGPHARGGSAATAAMVTAPMTGPACKIAIVMDVGSSPVAVACATALSSAVPPGATVLGVIVMLPSTSAVAGSARARTAARMTAPVPTRAARRCTPHRVRGAAVRLSPTSGAWRPGAVPVGKIRGRALIT